MTEQPDKVRRLHDRRPFDRRAIEDGVRAMLEAIGEDPGRQGLRRTPERVAEMFEEIFAGVGRDPLEELDVIFDEHYDEMIMNREIPLYSICEHHLVPFLGKAHVAYIPNKKGQITGLSKLARVVDVLSKRPQLQERLGEEIADAIEKVLEPRGVLVVIEAEHLCMSMRGVKKPGIQTVTSAVRGVFRENDATRAEAMALIARS